MLSRDPLIRDAQERARDTFGPPPSPARVAARTAEELAELVQAAVVAPDENRGERVGGIR